MAWRVVVIPKCSNTGVSGKVNARSILCTCYGHRVSVSAEVYVETFEDKITEVWGSRRST